MANPAFKTRMQSMKAAAKEAGVQPNYEIINWLIKPALDAEQEMNRRTRMAQRGTLAKLNPHISDAGKLCARQTYYSLINAPEDPLDLSSLVNFQLGHAAEELLSKLLTLRGAELLREVRVEIPYGGTIISGRSDFLVKMPVSAMLEAPGGIASLLMENQGDLIIELKTTKTSSFKNQIKRHPDGDPAHRSQLNLYEHASVLGLMPEGWGPFRVGLLIYIIKDSVKGQDNVWPYVVPYDAELAESDLRYLSGLKSLADSGLTPDRPPEANGNWWGCDYCAFKTHCWRQA